VKLSDEQIFNFKQTFMMFDKVLSVVNNSRKRINKDEQDILLALDWIHGRPLLTKINKA
jgi:hypothetical protein